jgi:hypothetical protein
MIIHFVVQKNLPEKELKGMVIAPSKFYKDNAKDH